MSSATIDAVATELEAVPPAIAWRGTT
jgi:hypothetical protein